MVKNLLTITQRRLDKSLQEQFRIKGAIKELNDKCQHIHNRIGILHTQTMLYEKSEELVRIAFWERQRLKAAVLAEIAQLEYQIETIADQMAKYQQLLKQITAQASILRHKCEKFQNYLKQQRIARCLKLERQQQNEIEELFVHVNQ